jgi:hydrogenase maturation protease
MSRPVRIIAWGNDGRRDDGAALALLQRVHAHPYFIRLNMQLDAYHQLGPEVSSSLVGARQVIFVDAHVNASRPDLYWERVVPDTAGTLDSHHCAPDSLLALCAALGESPPPCYVLGIRAYDCSYGDTLTPATDRLVDRAVKLIALKLTRTEPQPHEDLPERSAPRGLSRAHAETR